MLGDLAADAALAARLAGEAGELLLALRARGEHRGRALGDAGDRAANEVLLDALAVERPADGVLSEEAPDDPARLAAQRVWIIDPLDGTREYREGGDDWAVHVALTVAGQPVAGAVALPPRHLTLSTHPRPRVPAVKLRSHPRLLVSRTRPPAYAPAVAAAIGADLADLGSAGAKAMAVVLGEADAYVHDGGQWEWDSAAPVAVALAAGLHASRLDGRRLAYNQPDPRVDDLLICRTELAPTLLAAVARTRS